MNYNPEIIPEARYPHERLNLGSWIHPKAGYLNVDIVKWDGVDKVVDLNTLPWPFEKEQFLKVEAIDIIEHLGKLTKTEIIQELARITKSGGTIHIRVPAATHPIAMQSLQHSHSYYFDSFSTDYAQPWFTCRKRWVSLFTGRLRLPFRSPLRPFLRLLGRLGLLYCIEFELERIWTR